MRNEAEPFRIIQSKLQDYPGENIVFRINGITIGDTSECVDVLYCAKLGKEFLGYKNHRRAHEFDSASAEGIYHEIYDSFFRPINPVVDWGYHSILRSAFHLGDLAGESVRDKYGIILVARGGGLESVIWKNFKSKRIESATMPLGTVDFEVEKFVMRNDTNIG